MHIVFCNFRLAEPTGTELFLWDLLRCLQRRGHQCQVYSPRLGAIAERMRDHGIAVHDRLDKITGVPDVLHCHHSIETVLMLRHFPACPALYVCHDATYWNDEPPPLANHIAYAAVSRGCAQRIANANPGLPPEAIQLVPNSVDLERFPQRRDPLPAKPTRALLMASRHENVDATIVRAACKRAGMSLTVYGAIGAPICHDPGRIMGDYHCFFGKARCAQEAMACGLAVVLSGQAGAGPMVTSACFADLRPHNFNLDFSRPATPEHLLACLAEYDPVDVRRVSDRMRTEGGIDHMAATYEAIYSRLMADNPRRSGVPPPVLPLAWSGALLDRLQVESSYYYNFTRRLQRQPMRGLVALARRILPR